MIDELTKEQPETTPTTHVPQPAQDTGPHNRRPWRQILAATWRARGLWLGLLALDCALYGQKLITDQQKIFTSHQVSITYTLVPGAMTPAIRWYALAIVLAIIAWAKIGNR